MGYHVLKELLSFFFSPAKVSIFQYLSMLLEYEKKNDKNRMLGLVFFNQINNNI